jgi:hypothetical protein
MDVSFMKMVHFSEKYHRVWMESVFDPLDLISRHICATLHAFQPRRFQIPLCTSGLLALRLGPASTAAALVVSTFTFDASRNSTQYMISSNSKNNYETSICLNKIRELGNMKSVPSLYAIKPHSADPTQGSAAPTSGSRPHTWPHIRMHTWPPHK